jgi:SRSO17 transposase
MMNSVPIYHEKILEEIKIKDLTPLLFNKLFEDHICPYIGFLGREERKLHFEVILKGRISNVERKSNEAIALAFKGAKGERNLSNFTTRGIYDDADQTSALPKGDCRNVSSPRRHDHGRRLRFFQKRKERVLGVKRQYCGRSSLSRPI